MARRQKWMLKITTKMFADPDFRPDELKVYPCSLIESAALMQRYLDGSWRPYTHEELLHVLVECFRRTPEYCRLTRVIRDIPGTDIVDGNKTTNFRQLVEAELVKRRGEHSSDIRAREVRFREVAPDQLQLDELWYPSSIGEEVFLQFITEDRSIAGFLRLSLPNRDDTIADRRTGRCGGDPRGACLWAVGGDRRERAGKSTARRAGHAIDRTRAVALATERGYERLAVISAVGTRAILSQARFRGWVVVSG